MTLLRVERLKVRFGGGAEALGGIDIELDAGQSLAIVGESGAGKTTLARAIAGLLDHAEVHGSIRFDGRELIGMPEAELRELRWLRLAYAPQGVPLNPVTQVISQVTEPLRVRRGLSSKVAAARSRELASRVGLEPGLLERYPHQLSGGELRLALLTMALTCDPELIIMDEPAAGLDVLTANRFFERLHAAAQELESALIIISHDLPAATRVCSRTAVMYGGDIIEQGDTWRVVEAPAHPYSWALLNAYPLMSTSKDLRPIRGVSPDPRNLPSGCRFHPRCSQAEEICRKERPPLEQHRGRLIRCLLGGIQPLMRMQKVSKSYEVARRGARQQQPAVREVSLEVLHGEVVGLIGPSGSGKSTIGRLASAVMAPDSGQVLLASGHLGRALPGSKGLRAKSLAQQSGREVRQLRRQVQLIFQNPVEALNPRMRVLELVREALDIVGEGDPGERERALIASLAQVGLDPTPGLLESYGHQLSGGQQQRVAIARALLVRPRLLIADEPTSMLDASEQARLLQLLKSLQVEQGMGMLLISHDIALVRKVADRIVILQNGTVVEEGPSGTVATNPASALGRELVRASPAIFAEHGYASERPAPSAQRRLASRRNIVLEGHVAEGVASRGLTRAHFLRLTALGAAGLAAPGLIACGSSTKQGARPTIRLGADRDWGNPNPYGFVAGPGYWRMNRVFDTLIWKDDSGKFIPWLATKWHTPDEGHTWRFTLRPGIRWQDGKPLTARDVAFTFMYMQAHDAPPPANIGRPRGVAEARALSDTEVEIRMAIPFATFLRSQAGAVSIMPQHIWGSVSDPIAFSRSMGRGATIGSGPYRLASYSPGQGTYDFAANDNYFLGKPFVKRILEIPNTNVVLGLRNGDIDAGSPPPGPGAKALEALKGNSAFEILQGPSDFGTALQFNSSRGPLSDPRVRQAIAYAVDRQDMVRRSVGGIGAPGNPGFFPPTNPVYNKDVPAYDHDPGKARALLDSAGYPMRAGLRSGPGGPLRLKLLYSTGGGAPPAGSANDATNAALIASYLRAVGIAVQGQAAEGTDLDARTAAGQYEMLITTVPALGGEEIINFIFTSLGGGTGIPGFHNPQFNMDLMRQNVTFDPAARRKLLDRVQFIIAAQLPLLMLYYGTLSFAFRRSVFDAWYFTPGGFAGGIPSVFNKQSFVTGRQEGTSIKPFKQ